MREAMIIGEAGRRVARNVQRLREQQNLTYAEVSARLAGIGRNIPPFGISRIERTERRVDIDELIALAEVLRVPVDRLAFDDDLAVEVRVVSSVSQRTQAA